MTNEQLERGNFLKSHIRELNSHIEKVNKFYHKIKQLDIEEFEKDELKDILQKSIHISDSFKAVKQIEFENL